jgi:hypothetical protein
MEQTDSEVTTVAMAMRARVIGSPIVKDVSEECAGREALVAVT